MALVAFPLVLQSPSSGSAIVGATATITQHQIGGTLGTGPAATIYDSDIGGTPIVGNAIVTDDKGRWTQGASASYAQYWLPPGTYDIVITGTGLTSEVITRELVSAVNGGVCVNAGPGTRSSTSYGALGDARDEIPGLLLPTNGLIAVWYQATWQESVEGAARAAIFLGSNEIRLGLAGLATQSITACEASINASGAATHNVLLASCPTGLASLAGNAFSGAYAGDLTTGQVVGGGYPYPPSAAETWGGGPCHIFAPAGTYDLSVQFKALAGSVTASGRKLWVEVRTFG